MFNANDAVQPRRHAMKPYQFARLPSNASVAGLVTVLVSAWFVLAGGAILTDQHSEGTLEMARAHPAVHAEIAPEARLTIVVAARRSAAS
jgi:hypothetical protein